MIRADRSAGTAFRVVKLAGVLPASASPINFELENFFDLSNEQYPQRIPDAKDQSRIPIFGRYFDLLNHSQPLRRFHFIAV